DEQRRRFLDRIDTPSKNWKFNEADVTERAYWADYMKAYQSAIRATATADCPWYVIPADDKRTMRLLVSACILKEMQKLNLAFPKLPPEQLANLAHCRELLEKEP
ncbi:MAG: polyphosphate kinase 2 family protein, partial [Verrucomicrobiales bacterium]|nr:polyphosphate kinase 2 family protein [Verrucomicrobiales bacterium]